MLYIRTKFINTDIKFQSRFIIYRRQINHTHTHTHHSQIYKYIQKQKKPSWWLLMTLFLWTRATLPARLSSILGRWLILFSGSRISLITVLSVSVPRYVSVSPKRQNCFSEMKSCKEHDLLLTEWQFQNPNKESLKSCRIQWSQTFTLWFPYFQLRSPNSKPGLIPIRIQFWLLHSWKTPN